MFFKRPIVIITIFITTTMLLSYTISPILISWVSTNILVSTFLGQIFSFILPILGLYYFTSTDQEIRFDLSADFKPINSNDKFLYVLLAILIFGFLYTLKILIELIRAKYGIVIVSEQIDFHFLSFFGMVIIFAIVPAFLEEILYKGVISKIALNNIEIYVIVVLFFTLSHKGFTQGLIAFLFSNLLYILFLKTRNIGIMILVHFVYNVLVIIFTNYIRLPFELSFIRLSDRLFTQIDGFIYMVSGMLLLFVVFMSLLISKVKSIDNFSVNHLESKDWIHGIVFGIIGLLYIMNFIIINIM